MKTHFKFLGFLLLPLLTTSCGLLLGLDPAEKLAFQIESKSKELNDSDETQLEFDFIPSEWRLKKPAYVDRHVVLEFLVQQEDSLIVFNRWTWTTYHNRFVRVPETLRKVKCLGDPFRIKMKKSGDGIDVVGLD